MPIGPDGFRTKRLRELHRCIGHRFRRGLRECAGGGAAAPACRLRGFDATAFQWAAFHELNRHERAIDRRGGRAGCIRGLQAGGTNRPHHARHCRLDGRGGWIDVPRNAGVWFDVFAAVRIADGLDLVVRPVVNRRTFDGDWQKQLYQLGLRYERPGRIGFRLEAGHLPSPIGLAILENRPDMNPLVSPHSAYYLPLPRVDPDIPRSFLVAAAYPLGAQATVSGRNWDARAAVIDSSPVRGRPFFGTPKPPRSLNTVVGFGVKPYIGVRIGAALAQGAYAAESEVADKTRGHRDATMMQVEAEWSFRHTRLAARIIRSTFETAGADAAATGGWLQVTQTLTPRIFVAGRADAQRFRY